MSLLQLMNELNQECNFTESINESTFTESIKNQEIKNQEIKNLQYKSLVECIFSNYDPMYQTIPNHEKNLYVKKLIMTICSDIDENTEQ